MLKQELEKLETELLESKKTSRLTKSQFEDKIENLNQLNQALTLKAQSLQQQLDSSTSQSSVQEVQLKQQISSDQQLIQSLQNKVAMLEKREHDFSEQILHLQREIDNSSKRSSESFSTVDSTTQQQQDSNGKSHAEDLRLLRDENFQQKLQLQNLNVERDDLKRRNDQLLQEKTGIELKLSQAT